MKTLFALVIVTLGFAAPAFAQDAPTTETACTDAGGTWRPDVEGDSGTCLPAAE